MFNMGSYTIIIQMPHSKFYNYKPLSTYTVKPGSYPNFDEPAHVHITVKEPNDINEYYIDDYVFDDDKHLTLAKRNRLQNRCGRGVLRMVQKNDLQTCERNIILGLNIPDYPKKPDFK